MSIFKKKKKKEVTGPTEIINVLFTVKVTEDHDPMFGLKAKNKDLLNVIEVAEDQYIIAKDDKVKQIGYIPQKVCQKQVRKVKERVVLPKDMFVKFLGEKKYTKLQVDAVAKVQRWYRRIKQRRAIYKKLDNFGERLFSRNELLSNDSNYLSYLETINDLYYEPLKQVLTVEEHDGMFANFGDVLVVAREVNQCLTKSSVCGLKDVIDKLEVNSKYISNYSEAMEKFKKLRLSFERTPNAENSAKFLEIMNEGEKDERTCGLNFQNLLIKPFQRLVTYQNIIGTILKRTPKESFEHPTIQSVLEDVKKLCGVVNQERRSKMDQQWMKDTNVYAVGRKLVFKDSVFPVEMNGKERFNGTCYLFNDLLFIKKDAQETFSFYFFLTKIGEDQQQKKWLECKSIYRTARIMLKKKKEKTSWLDSIGKNMKKVEILSKRRHGISNINEFVDRYKYLRSKKNDDFEKKLQALQEKKNNELMEISYKKKQNHFIKMLFRTKIGEMSKNLEEILDHTKKCDEFSEQMNAVRVEKRNNVRACLGMLSKFRECMDHDIVEFYKIFEEDQSYCTSEMENLKKKIKSIDSSNEEKQLERYRTILNLPLNPLDQLDHFLVELERRKEEIDELKLRVEIIEAIESKFVEIKEKREEKERSKPSRRRKKTIMMSMDDDIKEKKEEEEKKEEKKVEEEETEGEGPDDGKDVRPRSASQALTYEKLHPETRTKIVVKQKICMVNPQMIDDYANRKATALKKKVYEKDRKIRDLQKRVEDLEIAKEVEKEISNERIAELVSQLEEEKAKLAGYMETVTDKSKKMKDMKKDFDKLQRENEQLRKRLRQ